ncbi:MAG TPA: Gfo/Idh/MocA family oxidoreductase [Vicinamibacterales bacterium]
MRTAVIGVGHLGRHHARILAAMDGAELVAVCDTNRDRANEIAAQHGASVVDDPASLAGAVDAVVVATPTASHLDVAMPLIEAGIAVLIEKPLARTLEEADALVAAARAKGVALAVGHTERFNPAVAAARPLLASPRFIECHRLGTFPDRSLDIDVVFDLMIHDLDVVLSFVDSPVAAIDAVGVPVLTPRIDIANVRLRFESGCIANLTASRISRDRVRKIRVFQPDSYVAVDYAAQELEVWRLIRGTEGPPRIDGGRVEVQRDEPLRRELEDFVTAVRDGRDPAVPGEDGRRALALAQQITDAMLSVV